MGLGSPADLLEAVHRGVDLFDSVLPARVARNGQLWVPGGRLNLRNQRFLDDPGPVQEDCPCLLCRRFSRAYIAHLFRAKELLAYRLATSSPPRSEEEAEGQGQPAQADVALGAAAHPGGADPEAAQAEAGRRRDRRGLKHRVTRPARGLSAYGRIDRSVTRWR